MRITTRIVESLGDQVESLQRVADRAHEVWRGETQAVPLAPGA